MIQEKTHYIIMKLLVRLFGLCLMGFSLIIVLALFSFDVTDPSFNSFSTEEGVNNWVGSFGSHISDLLFQSIGLASFFLCLVIFSIGSRVASRFSTANMLPKIILIPFFILCLSLFFSTFPQPSWWEFNSLGGVNGSFILTKLAYFPNFITLIFSAILSLVLLSIIVEITLSDWIYSLRYGLIITSFLSEKLSRNFMQLCKFKSRTVSQGDDLEEEEEVEEEEVDDDEAQEEVVKEDPKDLKKRLKSIKPKKI